MIDFNKDSVFRLKTVEASDFQADLAPILVPGEELVAAFKGARNHVVFTDKRIIAVDVQGISGKKRDYTTLPYAKVQAFSIETAGTFELDAELELWFSAIGRVRFEFRGRTDMHRLGQVIASYVL